MTEMSVYLLNRFVGAIQDKLDRSDRTGTQASAMTGPRYARLVVTDGSSRSAFGFVDMTTGDVLKADGWKGPAKGVRGNLLRDFDGALDRVGIFGGVR